MLLSFLPLLDFKNSWLRFLKEVFTIENRKFSQIDRWHKFVKAAFLLAAIRPEKLVKKRDRRIRRFTDDAKTTFSQIPNGLDRSRPVGNWL